MKKHEIQVGGLYTAKVSGKLTTVKVEAIREIPGHIGHYGLGINTRLSNDKTVYDVVNLKTGRKTTFRSAMKFRHVAKPAIHVVPVLPMAMLETLAKGGAS